MILWDNIVIILVFVGVLFALYYGWKKYKTWKTDKEVADAGILDDGSVIYKSEDGRYFYAIDELAPPVLISKSEGERLWSQSTKV